MIYTKEEIKKQIEEFERKKFYLDMKDRWESDDYSYSRELSTKISELKKMLK